MENSKTESLILEGKKIDRTDAKISVDGEVLGVGTSLRYLGFHLNKGLNMSHHLKIVCEKAKRVTSHFSSILPNVDGSTFLKRRLIIHAILSILWCGIEIWSSSCNKKKNVILITKTIRPLKRGLACAYKTVSDNVLDIITDIPPTELLIEKKLRTMQKIEDKTEVEIDINRRLNAKWEQEGEENRDIWMHKLLPSLQPWIERTHGETDFYLSQFFSGHGSFNSYLSKFKLAPSPVCVLYLSAPDTPEQTFFGCTHIKELKDKLKNDLHLNTDINANNIMELMLESIENWNTIKAYITKILKNKIAQNNKAHCQPNSTPSVAAGEKSPNRDDSGTIRADMQP